MPDGIASGRVVLDGALVDVVGWRATVGHNWGREHAERWVWLHAAGFADEPEAWLELAIARVRVGGALTPWIANGAVSVGGQRFRLGGLGHIPGVRVVAAPGRLEAVVPGERAEIRVAVHADLDQTVGFKYAGVGDRPGPRRARGAARRARRGPPRRPPAAAAARPSWRPRRAAPTSSAAASSRTACRCSPTRIPVALDRRAGATATRAPCPRRPR